MAAISCRACWPGPSCRAKHFSGLPSHSRWCLSTVALTVELVNGKTALNNPRALLSSGARVWLATIIAFTFAYWEIDAGGPAARAHRTAKYPHLAFRST